MAYYGGDSKAIFNSLNRRELNISNYLRLKTLIDISYNESSVHSAVKVNLCGNRLTNIYSVVDLLLNKAASNLNDAEIDRIYSKLESITEDILSCK